MGLSYKLNYLQSDHFAYWWSFCKSKQLAFEMTFVGLVAVLVATTELSELDFGLPLFGDGV
jgi:hypothetical protein